METSTRAFYAAQCALEKKAGQPVILDMRPVCNFCDYFVICQGNSSPQVRAIAEAVEEGLRRQKVRPQRREGVREGLWIVLDYGSIIVHVFEPETRAFYGLERLWADAPRLPIPEMHL
ncbi:MAG: ribosome silencing factor [Candidatus Omnitrophica bacterium]|nr:ribosome silencing factor [Candidatus Omnitrophota bacterium]